MMVQLGATWRLLQDTIHFHFFWKGVLSKFQWEVTSVLTFRLTFDDQGIPNSEKEVKGREGAGDPRRENVAVRKRPFRVSFRDGEPQKTPPKKRGMSKTCSFFIHLLSLQHLPSFLPSAPFRSSTKTRTRSINNIQTLSP